MHLFIVVTVCIVVLIILLIVSLYSVPYTVLGGLSSAAFGSLLPWADVMPQ